MNPNNTTQMDMYCFTLGANPTQVDPILDPEGPSDSKFSWVYLVHIWLEPKFGPDQSKLFFDQDGHS